MKQKCYVDGNLKIVSEKCLIKAIVNFVRGRVEILFLSPIAHDKNIEETWQELRRWAGYRYPNYLSAAPTVQTCMLANKGLKKPIVAGCYTSTDNTDFHGKREYWYAIGPYGNKIPGKNAKLANVYFSLFLTQEQFYAINPGAKLTDYELMPY